MTTPSRNRLSQSPQIVSRKEERSPFALFISINYRGRCNPPTTQDMKFPSNRFLDIVESQEMHWPTVWRTPHTLSGIPFEFLVRVEIYEQDRNAWDAKSAPKLDLVTAQERKSYFQFTPIFLFQQRHHFTAELSLHFIDYAQTLHTRHFLHRTHRVPSPVYKCGHDDEYAAHLLLELYAILQPTPTAIELRLNVIHSRPFDLNKILDPWTTATLQNEG